MDGEEAVHGTAKEGACGGAKGPPRTGGKGWWERSSSASSSPPRDVADGNGSLAFSLRGPSVACVRSGVLEGAGGGEWGKMASVTGKAWPVAAGGRERSVVDAGTAAEGGGAMADVALVAVREDGHAFGVEEDTEEANAWTVLDEAGGGVGSEALRGDATAATAAEGGHGVGAIVDAASPLEARENSEDTRGEGNGDVVVDDGRNGWPLPTVGEEEAEVEEGSSEGT